MTVTLRGITWGHTRGWLPVVAACSAWEDRRAGEVRVEWEQRSLWDFGEGSLGHVADEYDLMVIDHPLIGDALAEGLLAPLPAPAGDTSVGESQASYRADNEARPTATVWTLALDAACQIAVWRADLLDAAGCAVPETLDEVLALPESVAVAMPMAPVDLWCTWLSLGASLGVEPLVSPNWVLPADVAAEAMRLLAALVARSGERWLGVNPIGMHRAMSAAVSAGSGPAYVPFSFGYSNYARPGFAEHALTSGPSPRAGTGPSRTSLGGAGIAVSARRAQVDVAAEVAAWLASEACQTGPYLEAGGQPAARAAWTGEPAAALAGGYFANTLPALERAFARPTHRGMTELQTFAGDLLLDRARAGELAAAAKDLIDRIDLRWRALHGRA